jgi:hypothetical protein
MKRNEIMMVGGLVLVAGAILFWDQVKTLFTGMTPLEAMQTIVQYILHVTVITIVGFLIFGLPEIVEPWIKMAKRYGKQSSRRWKGGPNAHWQARTPKMPRLTQEQRFMLWLQQMQNGRMPKIKAPRKEERTDDDNKQPPLDMKF